MISQQEWMGIQSNKFNYTEVCKISNQKVHIRPVDQLIGFSGGQNVIGLGKVHFNEKLGKPYQWVSHMRVDIPRPGDGKTQEFELGKKYLSIDAKEKKPRAELLHVREGVSGHIEDCPYGIKTFPKLRCEKRHEIEKMMGQKSRVEYLAQMRNGLNVASLGDKAYKHPDYATDFYKEGGLTVGSTNVQRKVNINQLHEKEMEKKVQLIQSKIKKGTLWTDKLKLDQDEIKKADIDDLDKWIETTLKPSNPNYQDPDKFFENLEKQQQQDPKKGQAAQKKGGKK